MQQTYKTKLVKSIKYGPTDSLTSYLNEYSELFQKAKHCLYVDLVYRKSPINKLKKEYQLKFGINARQFNAIKADTEGIIRSKKELIGAELEEKESKLESFRNKLDTLIKKKKTIFEKLSTLKMNDLKFASTLKKYRKIKKSIHFLKRRIQRHEHKIAKIKKDIEDDIVRICFGSKELFLKQFNLKENGYRNHNEWLADWKNTRTNQCFYIGSSDETLGNQNCQYDKNNTLKIKTVPALEERYGKYIEIPSVVFKYGQENIDYCKESYVHTTASYNIKPYYKGALSHRFIRTQHGWYLHTTTDIKNLDIVTDVRLGGIGVDFNVNFVALTFVDRFGNPLDELSLKYCMYGKNSNQINARLGELSKELCDISLYYKVPIYIEDLCFAKAKGSIDKGKKYNRMIGSFPYSKFKSILQGRCKKFGVELFIVNPSYTSIIGQFKFMKKYGLSSHGAAACMIARKGMKFRTEKLPKEFKKFVFANKPKLNKSLNNYKMWIYLSSIIKKNMKFEDRIKMLYEN